jgi:hypothetical protein
LQDAGNSSASGSGSVFMKSMLNCQTKQYPCYNPIYLYSNYIYSGLISTYAVWPWYSQHPQILSTLLPSVTDLVIHL